MHRRHALQSIAAALAPAVAPWASLAQAAAGPSQLADWAASTRALGVKWLQQTASQNGVVAPLSIWGALAMLYAGARGSTAKQIARALNMPDQVSAFAQGWRAAQTLLSLAGPKWQLHLANRLWVQADYPIVPAYERVLQRDFAADLARVDFQGHTQQARQTINRWVARQTADQIRDLLSPGALTPDTRLALTQAVYLKAAWQQPFERELTQPDAFELAQGQKVQVPFMRQTDFFMAGLWKKSDRRAQLVELPYAGERLRMLVCVPQRAADLPAMLELLTGDWRKWMRRQRVELLLPRWKARTQLSLQGQLQAMGIEQVFVQGQADLSGMDGRRDLSVGAALHEACVDVTEQGTEAAAATALVVVPASAMVWDEPPLQIRVDRPFAWAIVDEHTRSMWFAGVVQDPR